MRVKDANARSFYEIECAKQNWSIRWLQRQVNSSLYERLALSKEKEEVMRLATEGQVVEKPADIIKNPITLEFLGLKPEASYSESKLENANIYATEYALYLPDKNELQSRLKEWIEEFENNYV